MDAPPSACRLCHVPFHAVILILTALFSGLVSSSKADGSRDLVARGGNRAFLEGGSGRATAGIGRLNRFFAYVRAGETLQLGSSAFGIYRGDILYARPDGVSGACSTDKPAGAPASWGRIQTINEEEAGPTPNAGGYTPCELTANSDTEGVWEVTFISPNPETFAFSAPLAAGAAWVQAADVYTIAAWDVSVRTTSGAIQAGRVYAHHLPLNLGDAGAALAAAYYVLTRDGYQYRVDMNGSRGHSLLLFANQDGFSDANSNQPLYRSIVLDPINAANKGLPAGVTINHDAQNASTHKLFLARPAADLPAAAETASGPTWLRASPEAPAVPSQLSYTGNLAQPGSFAFQASRAGRYLIAVDLNRNGVWGDDLDAVISGTASAGSNIAIWNGKDAQDQLVPGVQGGYKARVVMLAGEAHLPMFDVEHRAGGLVVERLDAGDDAFVVRYDDYALAARFGGPATPRNAGGTDSRYGAHAFREGYGDDAGIDTWMAAESTPAFLNAPLFAPRTDLRLSLALDNPAPARGEPVRIEATLANDGPDGSANTRVAFHIPDGLALLSAVPEHGAFDVNTRQWVVDDLASGGAANLTLSLAAPEAGPYNVYGQVVEYAGDDPDSSPNNFNPLLPDDRREDDTDGVAIYAEPAPAIGLAQRVLDVTGSLSGFEVTYELRIENLGNAPLTDVQAVANLGTAFHGADVRVVEVTGRPPLQVNASYNGKTETNLLQSSASQLDIGQAGTIVYTASVTPFTNFGPYENSVQGYGYGPGAAMASDVSDHGTVTDANQNGTAGDAGEDDPTPVDIAHRSVIGLALEATGVDGQATDFTADMRLTVENLGDAPLTDVQVTLGLESIFGAGNFTVSNLSAQLPLTKQATYNGGSVSGLLDPAKSALKPGEKAVITFEIQASPRFSIGHFNLRARASAHTIDGTSVTDFSDDGNQPDANGNGTADDTGEDDTTVIAFEGDARIGAALTTSRVTGDLSGFTAFYELKIQNLGDTPLHDIQAIEDLATVFDGTSFSVSGLSGSPSLTIDTNFDGVARKNLLAAGNTLQAHQTVTVSYAVTVSPESTFGPYKNTVVVYGDGDNGAQATDISDSGTSVDADQDGNPDEPGENDPTVTAFAHNGRLGGALAINAISGDLSAFGLSYTLVLENLGDVPISGLALTQDLKTAFAGARYEVVDIETEAPFKANDLFDGDAYKNVLDQTSDVLDVGQRAEVTVSLSVTPVDAFGPYALSAEAAGDAPFGTRLTDLTTDGFDPDPNGNGNPNEAEENAPSIVNVTERPVLGISMAKAGILGDHTEFIAKYVLRLENLGDAPLTDVQVRFDLTEVFQGAGFNVLAQRALGSITPTDAYDGAAVTTLLDAAQSRLAPGDTARLELDVKVRPDIGFGPYTGNALATARGPGGATTTDLSNSGYTIDPNDNGVPNEKDENAPTQIALAAKPAIGTARALTRVTENGDRYDVDVAILIRNLGDVPLNNLELIETAVDFFSGADVEIRYVNLEDRQGFEANPAFDGFSDVNVLSPSVAVLKPGDGIRVSIGYTLSPTSNNLSFDTRSLVRAQDPAGVGVEDWSNDGADPDPDGNRSAGDEGEDRPTTIRLNRQPAFELATRLNELRGDSTRFDAQFAIFLTNSGDTRLDSLQIDLSLSSLFAGATVQLMDVRVLTGESVALNATFDGNADVKLLHGATSSLDPGRTAHLLLDATVTPGGAYGPFSGRALAFARAGNASLDAISEFAPIRVATSSGFDAGLESNGTLAVQVAERAYRRRRDVAGASKNERGNLLSATGLQSAHGPGGFAGQEAMDLVPDVGPDQAEAVVTTPRDLYGITNATSVLAIDYVKGAQRIAGLFSTTTPAGELYEHAKNVCDRLQGASLRGAELVAIRGYPFVLSVLEHPSGDVDYAISFVGYRQGAGYLVDSRFVRDQYTPSFSAAGEVLNFQVWSFNPAHTIALVTEIIQRMEEAGGIDFASREDDIPKLPNTFVERGFYRQGSVVLFLKNLAGTSELRIEGETSATEGGARQTYTTVVPVPADLSPGGATPVVIPTGVVYDALLNVQGVADEGMDQIYLADGAWGQAAGQQEDDIVESFEILEQPPYTPHENHFVVERGVHFKGKVASETTLFRHFTPGGRRLDLSAYEYVTFVASGQGRVQVRLEEAGSQDPYFIDIELSASARRHTVYYDDFAKRTSAQRFSGASTTAISFVFTAGAEPEAVELRVHDVLFGKGAPVGIDDATLPIEYSLAQNYPNPFNPVTTIEFGLPEPAEVRLEVFDMLGRRVTTVIDQEYAPGKHSISFDGSRLASGSYVYRLVANDRVFSKMMHVLK